MPITIQPYEKSYQEAVITHILTIQQDEFQIPITREEQPDLAAIPSIYQQGKGNFWLALDAGRVVGTLGLIDIGQGMVALRKMFVNPAYRGAAGPAARLWETARNWAEAQGVSRIYLGTTSRFLAAHRFYEKHGFLEIRKAELPPAFPVMAVDSKFYCYTYE